MVRFFHLNISTDISLKTKSKNRYKISVLKRSSTHWTCLICYRPILEACCMKAMLANCCCCFLIFIKRVTNRTIIFNLLFINEILLSQRTRITAVWTQTWTLTISEINHLVDLGLLIIFFSLNNIFLNPLSLSTFREKLLQIKDFLSNIIYCHLVNLIDKCAHLNNIMFNFISISWILISFFPCLLFY